MTLRILIILILGYFSQKDCLNQCTTSCNDLFKSTKVCVENCKDVCGEKLKKLNGKLG